MYTSKEIAERIKEELKKQKKSVLKMCTETNINKNAIFTMQNSGYLPQLETIDKIANYLNVSIDYLTGRTDNPDINK